MFYGLQLQHLVAGFIVIMVGFTSSVAIIFQAAAAAGATTEQISSWVLALGIGMGLTSLGFSLAYRMPILTAWSTPGAALLVSALVGLSLAEAVGVFIFAAILTIICGLSGWVKRLSERVPAPIAAAMLAGVLFRFGVDVFVVMQTHTALVLLMLSAYLLGRRWWPRYTIILALLLGLGFAAIMGDIQTTQLTFSLSKPVFVMPEFNLTACLSVGIPLFIVTMTSQNLPGLAVLKAHGYTPPASPLITWTGVTGLLLAPFGGYAFNLAAITAAICMSEDAGTVREKRYLAAVCAGVFYLLTGLFGATVVALFAALPAALVITIAGLALFATIGNALQQALAPEEGREAALITFLVTASGMVLWGLGSAVWGLLAGMLAHRVFSQKNS